MSIFALRNYKITSLDKVMSLIENSEELFVDKLKECVENTVRMKMRTPRNFEFLSECIFNETRNQLSATTLKRLWGYLHEKEKQMPRLSTLNILSRYVGYSDYETFCKFQQVDGECESNFLQNNSLSTKSLRKGDSVRLMWNPDRCVTAQYIGLCMFRVVDSKNSKLSVNDTFICEHIVENVPLLLSNLIHENGDPVNYICGNKSGVKFQIIMANDPVEPSSPSPF